MSDVPRLRPTLAALPLDAALDVFYASAGASAALEPHLEADVQGLLARILADGPDHAPLALAAPTVAPAAAAAVEEPVGAIATPSALDRLLRLVDGLRARADRRGVAESTALALAHALERALHAAPTPPTDALRALAGLAWDGPEQLAVLGVGPLLAAARASSAASAAVVAAVQPLASRDASAWREHATLAGRDALASRLVERALLHGRRDLALALATAWPPGRAGLLALAVELAGARELGALGRLLGRYQGEGVTAKAAVVALWEDAERRSDDSLAAWLAARTADPAALPRLRALTPPPLWPTRRDALIEAWLAGGAGAELAAGAATAMSAAGRARAASATVGERSVDGAWLIDALAEGPDAIEAVDAVCALASARPRLLARAAAVLRRLDPERALARDCQRLRDALRVGGQQLDRLEVKRLRQEVEASAAACGEPGLAADYVALLQRELEGAPTPRR